jgi:hypothetical protein
MARTFARLLTRIWQDPDFVALSSGAQRVYILAISQATTNLVGVTTWTPRRWARLSKDSDAAGVEADVAELVATRFAVIDEETEEFWARSFVRHDGVLDVPNVIKSMTHDFEVVQSPILQAAILDWFKIQFPDGFSSWLCDRYPNAFPKGLRGLNQRFMEGLAEPLPEPLAEPLPEGFTDGFPRAWAHARVCAQPSPSPSPSPTPSPAGSTVNATSTHPGLTGRDGALRTETQGQGQGPTQLIHRLAAACTATNRDVARIEATNVIQWAIRYVDTALIEDGIFWAETRDGNDRIKLPRGVAITIREKAHDKGIAMPAFDPRAFA